MRYFDLKLTDKNGNIPTMGGVPLHWTTHPGGIMAPGDANYPLITFDATVVDDLSVSATTIIRVFGVPLELLSSATQMVGLQCTLSGGMAKGLPLSSSHPGVLVHGTVWQALGNWVGTDMTLDLVIDQLWSFPGEDRPIPFQWKPGQTLAAAITAALQTIFGPLNVPINVSGVSPNYAPPSSVKTHLAQSVDAFGQFLYAMTKPLAPGPVKIAASAKGIVAYTDARTGVLTVPISNGVIPVEFNEMIGQPTWIGLLQCQVKTVLRGDLDVRRMVTILQSGQQVLQSSPGLVTVTAASGIGLPVSVHNKKYIPSFKGNFWITQLRHIGNSRSSDSGEWATIFNAVALNQTGPSASAAGMGM